MSATKNPARAGWAEALRRAGSGAVSAAALGGGLFVAGHHPIAPLPAAVLFLAWFAAALRRPSLALVVLPAALPLMDFSPWTGWIVVDEFDLLLLATIAAVHAREAARSGTASWRASPRALLVALLALACTVPLLRGLADGGLPIASGGLYAGPGAPLNGLRVAKSLGCALLLLPLWRAEMRLSVPATLRRLRTGVLAGLWIVVLAVLWERAAFPGLLDFSQPYRTVALFWEMHLGGAAIDAYLALTVPFVAWALHEARTPARWSALALLALLAAYAALTTFSRGVYVAVAAPLLLLASRRGAALPRGSRAATH